MTDKTWSDQPDEVISAHKVGGFQLTRHKDSYQVEVRTNISNEWFVTIGNLFHSETIKCVSAEDALREICVLGTNHVLCSGAVLLQNARGSG